MISSTTGMMIGTGLLGLGMIIILLSPYRSWLGFMLAGMAFWSFLEMVRVGSQYLFSFTDFQGYMTGVGVALGLLAAWLAATEEAEDEQQVAEYIEHTPVYEDDLHSISRH